MAKLITPPFRMAFIEGKDANDSDKWKHFLFDGLVQVDSKTKVPNGKLKYQLCAIWTPARFTSREKAQWKEIMEALDAASTEGFKRKWADLGDGYKKGIRDGANAPYAGFGPGTKFANLGSVKPATQNRPEIIDIKGNTIKRLDDGTIVSVDSDGVIQHNDKENGPLIYPGCWARSAVNPYHFSVPQNKGLGIGFRNIQILDSTAPRLDGGSSAKDDYGDVDVELAHLREQDESAVDE